MVSRVKAKIWAEFETLLDSEFEGILKPSQIASLNQKLAVIQSVMSVRDGGRGIDRDRHRGRV